MIGTFGLSRGIMDKFDDDRKFLDFLFQNALSSNFDMGEIDLDEDETIESFMNKMEDHMRSQFEK